MIENLNKDLLNNNDLELLAGMGISGDQFLGQVNMSRKGASPVTLVKAAAVNDGLVRFAPGEQETLVDLFTGRPESGPFRIVKFVPASGAATRMFKTMLHFNGPADEIEETETRKRARAGEDGYGSLLEIMEGIKNRKFAFMADLEKALAGDGYDMNALLEKGYYKTIIDYLLTAAGLDYACLPKGLIKSHGYTDGYSRTAFEEHLVEGMAYSKDKNGVVHIHFTVAPEFRQRIIEHIDSVLPRYTRGEESGTTFNITYSEQMPRTDTAAVDENNNLFRDENNNLVLRPGGHGALIENLDLLDCDMVFIKNIDNVVPDALKHETIRCKKMLGGYLIKLQETTFAFLKRLSERTAGQVTGTEMEEMTAYAQEKLNISFPGDFNRWGENEKKEFLIKKLNRPLRVCGMVKNEGEPGGGPFLVEGRDGSLSLQIVEGAQIDKNSVEQLQILKSATHFNPVDLVCGITDYLGNKFDLHQFVDREAYFIAHKFWKGRPLKALELPGLWNGAMADWITIFVEVPLITFNPIKTVNDLLRKEHRTQ